MPLRRRLVRLTVTLATASCAMTLSPRIQAQRWLFDAEAGLGSGMEAGGSDRMQWQRARTRVLTGLDLRVDETAWQGYGIRMFVELERRAALGAELRALWWITPSVGVHAGGIGILAPRTLFGPTLGAAFLIPLGGEISIFIEPSLGALPMGSDVPDQSVVVWTLLSGGLRARL